MKWINTPTGYAIQDDDGRTLIDGLSRTTAMLYVEGDEAARERLRNEINRQQIAAQVGMCETHPRRIYEAFAADQRAEDNAARRAAR